MKHPTRTNPLRVVCGTGIAFTLAISAGICPAQSLTWQTIANNATLIPGTTVTFNSFNQPAVNSSGIVVFRARSKGDTGGPPVHGVYIKVLAPQTGGLGASLIVKFVARGDAVPQPNNTLYNGVLASFEEFPSTPRIDIGSSMLATRGQSQPVYEYQVGIDPATGLPLTTKVGTSGIYANPGGAAVSGATLLGAVTTYPAGTMVFPYYAVPGAPAATRFDQFPGSPAVTNGTTIVFKGNYTDPTDGLGKTGVYYRDVAASAGKAPIQLIASTATVIPNPPGAPVVKFGSTAPPSAAKGYMVFTGLDVEDAPTRGGIYRAPLQPSPPLQTLAGIGDQVPGEPAGTGFTVFGEALSISADARYVSFWGAWGVETFNRVLHCPPDGQEDVLAYCNENYPAGYTAAIPVHQGIFVADAQTGTIYPIAKTLANGYTDFLYWVFSGRPPGTGGGDEPSLEPPRWRSSAFSALDGNVSYVPQTAFKASKSGVDGIYLRRGTSPAAQLVTVVETLNQQGTSIDAQAPANSIVTAVGLERDAYRNGNLAVSVSMLYADPVAPVGWAGLYLTKIAGIPIVPEGPGAPVLVSATTRPIASGSRVRFELPVSISTATPTIEPRNGNAHELILTFDQTVVSGSAAVTKGTGQVTGISFSGKQVIVGLSQVADAQYVTVTISNLKVAPNGSPGSSSVRIGYLRGDVSQNGSVTAADTALVSAQLGAKLTSANYLLDVDLNGKIGTSDVTMVQGNMGKTLPAP